MNKIAAEIRLRLSPAFLLDCAFEAPAGFTVLFGHSGAGKTSVLDCIAGLKSPDSGTISLDGTPVFDSGRRIQAPPAKRRIAYVFQSLALFPHLSVEENTAYGISDLPPNEREHRSRTILEQFGIDHFRSRKPDSLSGGERQRVALARSLVTDPRALLLDEPLAALDRKTRMNIVDDLRRWNAIHQVPVLYVTHSVREALALGERVLMMQSGRISAGGSPTELLDPEDWE